MKNFFYIFILICFLVACAPSKPLYPGSTSAPPPEKGETAPKIPENIVVRSPRPDPVSVDKPLLINTPKEAPGAAYSAEIEKCHYLQFKYAILMEEPVESVRDEKLITFLEDWYGTPYRFGGGTRKGIDCSAFTGVLMDSVYDVSLPRTARSQYYMGTRIRRNQLTQGDLVFFNTTGGISHVGVYLANNKFVHASASSGVMISDLEDVYFKRRYAGAARVR